MSQVRSPHASGRARPIAHAAIAATTRRELRTLANKAIHLFRTGQAENIPTVVGALAARFAQRLGASALDAMSSSELGSILQRLGGVASTALEPLPWRTADGKKPFTAALNALMVAEAPLSAARRAVPRLQNDVAAAGREVHALDARVPADALPLLDTFVRAGFSIQHIIDLACRGAEAAGKPVYFVSGGEPHTAFPPSDPRAQGQMQRLLKDVGAAVKAPPAAFAAAQAKHHGALVLLRREEALQEWERAAPDSAAKTYCWLQYTTRTQERDFFGEAFDTLTRDQIAPFIAEVKRRGVIPEGQTALKQFVARDFYGDQPEVHFYKDGFPDTMGTAAVWAREWKV